MTSIGPKRHFITFEQPANTTTDFGQAADDWTDYGNAWGELKTLGGRELVSAQQTRAETTHRFETRWDNSLTITADMRIKFGTRRLKITAAYDPENRGRILFIDCWEWPQASGDGQ